jgi:hypothetical protein
MCIRDPPPPRSASRSPRAALRCEPSQPYCTTAGDGRRRDSTRIHVSSHDLPDDEPGPPRNGPGCQHYSTQHKQPSPIEGPATISGRRGVVVTVRGPPRADVAGSAAERDRDGHLVAVRIGWRPRRQRTRLAATGQERGTKGDSKAVTRAPPLPGQWTPAALTFTAKHKHQAFRQ